MQLICGKATESAARRNAKSQGEQVMDGAYRAQSLMEPPPSTCLTHDRAVDNLAARK
jgi:hypothetical protein